ncbi:MAG: cytidylate kinase [Halobacteriovoraceae bacterium]|nr:cytidylate kinase [Peredibacter sp.]MBJ00800.1 cytidylate kinase [Halobacteriovoraceae bacterium]|tara:strand:- start:127 stop:831 length:705 start_codon:yes stop_codon:yes gene_type:complete
MKDRVIAIDGPSGSGKSTITKLFADKIGFTYLDTGAMFRALAYKLNTLDIDFSRDTLTSTEELEVERFLDNLDFQYAPTENVLISVNGEDLTRKIREHHVSKLASQTSKFSVVREFLANLQRKIAKRSPCILEGRDIGTVIFPNAALKFYLTANSDVRAQRRLEQLQEKGKADGLTLKQIKEDIEKRDDQDTQREVAPLKKADDAFEIDTSNRTVKEVLNLMFNLFQDKESLFK